MISEFWVPVGTQARQPPIASRLLSIASEMPAT